MSVHEGKVFAPFQCACATCFASDAHVVMFPIVGQLHEGQQPAACACPCPQRHWQQPAEKLFSGSSLVQRSSTMEHLQDSQSVPFTPMKPRVVRGPFKLESKAGPRFIASELRPLFGQRLSFLKWRRRCDCTTPHGTLHAKSTLK